MPEFSVVGKPLPRVDGVAKAGGAAKFADDFSLPGMLYGKILRSPHPHARILSIDTSRAEALSGVKAVVTGREVAGVKLGSVDTPRFPADEPPLAVDKVRYAGEGVVAVCAVSEDIAEEALELVQVEYEPLPAVFDPEEAMHEGAPRVHEEIVPAGASVWEQWGIGRTGATKQVVNNIAATFSMSYGDVEKGFQEADYTREDTFYIPATSHAALEPHSVLASYDPLKGTLEMWTSHMGYEPLRASLSRSLDLPMNCIHVRKTYVGGAFGGKVELFPYQFLAAYLSKKTSRPVKITLTREEVFTSCRVSNRMKITVKTGVKRDGTIVAMKVRVINDPGAYRGSSPIALYLTYAFSSPIYRIPNLRYEGVAVYTNKGVCGPKRGHGSQQSRFAIESQLDIIAQELGLDPGELRLKNAHYKGDVLPNGDRLDSCGLPEAMAKAMEASGWKGRRRWGNWGLGMGVAAMFSGSQAYPFASAALVRFNPDGTATLFTGATETGQGSDTAMCQIAAEELGLSLEDIALVSGDSEACPLDYGNALSGGIYVTGQAVRRAAEDARRQLLEVAAGVMEVGVEDLEVKGGRLYLKGAPEKGISFAQVVREAVLRRGGENIIGRGFAKPVPEVVFGPSISSGKGRFSDAYGYAVAVAEVEVDRETGRTRVIKITTAEDCGFPINPLNVEGQVEGQAVMALGDIFFEEVATEGGVVVNPDFSEYKIPGPLDIPELETIHIYSVEPKGPFGAKEAGECSRAAVMAALANAVAQASGARVKELPITPERILVALKKPSK